MTFDSFRSDYGFVFLCHIGELELYHDILVAECKEQTYMSYPYNDYPWLALVDSSLRAYTKAGRWITNATAVSSGGTLGWVTSRLYSQPAAKAYTGVQTPAGEFPLLAAYGITDLWSLCPFFGPRGQTNVVFNVSADMPPPPYLGFDPATCYEVKINIIPFCGELDMSVTLMGVEKKADAIIV